MYTDITKRDNLQLISQLNGFVVVAYVIVVLIVVTYVVIVLIVVSYGEALFDVE